MKKTKITKIQIDAKTKKEFIVNELTIKEIIELSQLNDLFGAEKDEETNKETNKTFLEEVQGLKGTLGQIIEKSCDFTIDDLKELAPSDIEKVYADWQEVNQTFLNCLERMGITAFLSQVMQKGLSDFLKIAAI